MSVDKGFLNLHLYRGDFESYELEMTEIVNGTETDIDIAAVYDEIILQVRTANDPRSTKIIDLRLSTEEITISNTKLLSWSMQTSAEAGTYFFDMTFKLAGGDQYLTLIKGNVIIENDISRP